MVDLQSSPLPPNRWETGYEHRAFPACPSCQGLPADRPECGVCGGAGFVIRGCGGEVEMDLYYRLANCFGCGHMIDPAEVSRKSDSA